MELKIWPLYVCAGARMCAVSAYLTPLLHITPLRIDRSECNYMKILAFCTDFEGFEFAPFEQFRANPLACVGITAPIEDK
jgi:hypothetical protein